MRAGIVKDNLITLISLFLFGVIGAIDLEMPLGVAAGVPYILPVLITYFARSSTATLFAAFTGTIMTIGGFILSSEGGVMWMVLTNRGLALFAIWSTAALIIQHHAKQKLLHHNFHIIDQNVLFAEMNRNGEITSVSNALSRYLAISQNELIGAKSNFFGTSMPKELLREIWTTINTGKSWEGDIQHTNNAGDIKWAHSIIHPIFDKDYNITRFNNILTDITDRKKVEEIALTDVLTDLPNRRSYEATLEREINIARRGQWALTLAIIDIDYFKNYNDHYGHPEGDVALSNVANALKYSLRRPNDFVARIGGEEFALIFSQCEAAESEEFLEKIRKFVVDLMIPNEKSAVHDYLTISIGSYVCSKKKAVPIKELFFSKADKALYTAKEKRNSVVVVSDIGTNS